MAQPERGHERQLSSPLSLVRSELEHHDLEIGVPLWLAALHGCVLTLHIDFCDLAESKQSG